MSVPEQELVIVLENVTYFAKCFLITLRWPI